MKYFNRAVIPILAGISINGLQRVFADAIAYGPSREEICQAQLGPDDMTRYKAACPDYKHYAAHPQYDQIINFHKTTVTNYIRSQPYSSGPLELPFQRPSVHCRTFESQFVEQVIDDI